MLPASDAGIEGFVRVVNLSDRAGTVRIHAIDDTGERFGPVTLALDANETVNFRSRELEQGNAAKGLPSGVGDGEGYWRLELESVLHIGPLAYVRTADGFLTSMHDLVPETGGRHQVLFFNPGECAPGGEVRLTLPAGAARMLSARDLESGGNGFDGSFGDGRGWWAAGSGRTVARPVDGLFPRIASFEALEAAAQRAARGKRRKPGVAAFLRAHEAIMPCAVTLFRPPVMACSGIGVFPGVERSRLPGATPTGVSVAT